MRGCTTLTQPRAHTRVANTTARQHIVFVDLSWLLSWQLNSFGVGFSQRFDAHQPNRHQLLRFASGCMWGPQMCLLLLVSPRILVPVACILRLLVGTRVPTGGAPSFLLTKHLYCSFGLQSKQWLHLTRILVLEIAKHTSKKARYPDLLS